MIMVDLLTVAKLVDNYAIDATAGAPWTTDKLYKVTVPVGKRWFFIGGAMKRDVASTAEVVIKNAGDELVFQLDSFPSATTMVAYPSTIAQVNTLARPLGPIIMDAGGYVQISFATSQTGGAHASFNVLEVDV